MAQTFSSDFRSCAACNFWEGARELDATRAQITVDSLSIKGKCLLQGGPLKGWDMQASFICSKWGKWVVLK